MKNKYFETPNLLQSASLFTQKKNYFCCTLDTEIGIMHPMNFESHQDILDLKAEE